MKSLLPVFFLLSLSISAMAQNGGSKETSEVDLLRDIGHEKVDVNVFPNPSTGEFTIELDRLEKQVASVKIYDQTGHLVEESNLSVNRSKWELSGYSKGIYWVMVTAGSHTQSLRLEIVQ